MAGCVRRLQSLRHSLSPLATRTRPALASSVLGSGPICGVEAECTDRSSCEGQLRFSESGVLGSVSVPLCDDLGQQGGFVGGADCHWDWRYLSSARCGGVFEGLGFGARGFAAKAKKSGGKARNDDGGGQMLTTPGPSAKEMASRLMEAALNALSVELSKLRTGRASPGMLDHVNVTSHGVQTPLSHVAAVSVSSLETLTVMPYDSSMVKEVEKAIRNSPLKLNPVAEGEVLRVPIPKLTKEHIQTMSKLVGKAGETAKLSVRRARKDAMDMISKGGFSKDEVKRFEKEVEDVTKKYVKSVEDACKSKEKEILGNS